MAAADFTAAAADFIAVAAENFTAAHTAAADFTEWAAKETGAVRAIQLHSTHHIRHFRHNMPAAAGQANTQLVSVQLQFPGIGTECMPIAERIPDHGRVLVHILVQAQVHILVRVQDRIRVPVRIRIGITATGTTIGTILGTTIQLVGGTQGYGRDWR